MAASDRTKTGNRNDYARHFSPVASGTPVCGNKNYGYITPDKTDVDCKKWLKKLTI